MRALKACSPRRCGPGATAHHPIEPGLGRNLVVGDRRHCRPADREGRRFALVTSPLARRALGRLLSPHLPDVPVLSFLEIPDGKPSR
jgi:flagellar biosynthesis protein FlhA